MINSNLKGGWVHLVASPKDYLHGFYSQNLENQIKNQAPIDYLNHFSSFLLSITTFLLSFNEEATSLFEYMAVLS